MTSGRPDPVVDDREVIAAASRRIQALLEAQRVPGFATVDLERAAADAAITRSLGPEGVIEAPADELLGARCRIVVLPARRLQVLLEPSTEGRLAASLARFGEGYLVEYLVVPDSRLGAAVDAIRAAGLAPSAEAMGPFGRERLLTLSPAWGPHLILAARDPAPGKPDAAVTILR